MMMYICPKKDICSEMCSHKEPHEDDTDECYEEECDIVEGTFCVEWNGKGNYEHIVRCAVWDTCTWQRECKHKDWHMEYDSCRSEACSPEDGRDHLCIPRDNSIIDVDELFEDIEL